MARQEEEEDEEERSRRLKPITRDTISKEKGGETLPTSTSDRELPTPRIPQGREEGSKEGASSSPDTRPIGLSADSRGSPSSDQEQSVDSHLISRIPTTKKVKNRSGSPSRRGERRGGSKGESSNRVLAKQSATCPYTKTPRRSLHWRGPCPHCFLGYP